MKADGPGKNILITGGAGFIGSHVVKYFVRNYPGKRIICLDKLTYSGNLENLRDIENFSNYVFIREDICNLEEIEKILRNYEIDGIIHLAAESHVDRSIRNPFEFAHTNVLGTLSLLEAGRKYWTSLPGGFDGKLFYHISTDEVYGSLEITNSEPPYGDDIFVETKPYQPHSPYAASKASSDHFVRAYHDTFGMPAVISNCSNNYGPYQFPEKLIPLFVRNILNRIPLPIYGKGENIRDWLYVGDHVKAIDTIFHKGVSGETYNIGGSNEWKNIDLVKLLVKITDRLTEKPEGYSESLITFIEDRKGHDLRYAIDSSKLRKELGWSPSTSFEKGLEDTVKWYLENEEWLKNVTSGDYLKYYEQYYHSK